MSVADDRTLEKTHEIAERLREIAEKAPIGMALKDAAGRCLWTNPAMQRMLGYGDEELRGMFRTEFTHPGDAGEDARVYEELARGERDGFQAEKRYVRKDGGTVWGRLSVFRVGDESDLALVVVEDVDERKRTEKALRASEARFRTVIEQSPMSVHVFAPDGRSLRANSAWDELWGRDGDAEHPNLFEDEHLEVTGLTPYVDESVREGRAVRTPPLLYAPAEVGRGGDPRWLEASVYPVRDEAGHVREMVLVVEDVTALKRVEERYRTLVEQVPVAVYIQDVDHDRAIRYVSPRIEEILGYSPREYDSDPGLWVRALHPEDRERVLAENERTGATGDPFSHEHRMVRKDGRVVWVRDEAVLMGDGADRYWRGIMLDITDQKRTEANLAEAQRLAHLGSWEWDSKTDELYWSDEVFRIYGLAPQSFVPTFERLLKITHPDDRAMLGDYLDGALHRGEPYVFQHRVVRPHGEVRWVHRQGEVAWDDAGEPVKVVGTVQDITERKILEERLEHQALHDPLTGLPNRALLEDRLRQATGRTGREGHGTAVAVLFLDIDNFKVVNDSLGHEAGDRLLVAVAERLRAVLRPGDTVARLGGDEFIFLLEGVGTLDAVRVAERVREVLKTPFALGEREMFVTASVGVAVSRADARKRPEDLIREADLAMYRAKRSGRAGHAIFEEKMSAEALGRLELDQGLRTALEGGEFEVFYQPKVSLSSGEIEGFEALVRWEHPERGIVSPDEFVPVAEETGLIVPIGEWVLAEACRHAKGWHDRFPSLAPTTVCVNLSARQFRDPDLPRKVARILGGTGLEPRYLDLEITESAAMGDAPATIATLKRLKDVGVRVAIDDFGTGYSSLSYLERFLVDDVKIDRAFVGKLGEESGASVLVSGIVDLSHALGLKVTAEGVETEEQLERLRETGCDAAQGYYFSEPLHHKETETLLAARAERIGSEDGNSSARKAPRVHRAKRLSQEQHP